jgi:choline-glycine betaine transporter
MIENKIMFVSGVLFIAFLISAVFFGILGSIYNSTETKEVKCFDKYSNEIIGQTCKENTLVYPFFQILSILFILALFSFMVNRFEYSINLFEVNTNLFGIGERK